MKDALFAAECLRWLYAVRRDIAQNAELQARQRASFPEKKAIIEAQHAANGAEYLKTLAAVERVLDPDLEKLIAAMGVDVRAELEALRRGATLGDIEFEPVDFSRLRR